MYGVVLWSDEQDSKAVIWCEDHGRLAFYTATENSAFGGSTLDSGDLVEFDLTEGSDMRHAHNPRLVAQDQYPTLAQDLSNSGILPGRETKAPAARTENASNVVSFSAPPLPSKRSVTA